MGLEIIGDILGAVAPAISAFGAGKNQASPQVVNTLPPEVQKAMMELLPRIKSYGATPYEGLPFRRNNAADNDPIFGSKARQDLQGYYDQRAVSAAQAAQESAASNAQASQRPVVDSQANEVALRRALATDPNDMSADAKAKRHQLYKMNVALQNFQDGQVNPVTGEKFDRGGFLDFLQRQEDQRTMFPSVGIGTATGGRSMDEYKAFLDEGDKYHYQTFIPSKSKQSFLGRFGAPLMLAAMTAGAGAAGVPAMTLKGLKGVTSLAQMAGK